MLPKFKAPTSIFEKIKGVCIALFYFPPLFISVLLVNVLQILVLPVLLVSPKLFRRIMWAYAFAWWGAVVFLMERVRKIKLIYTGDFIPEKENVILIANHQEMSDVPAILCFAFRQKCISYLKWFAKDIIKYFPGPGWGLYIAGNFFVKRNWLQDQKTIDKTFSKVLRNREPFWLITFLEGTRITQKKLAKSQSFANERNRPVLQHLLAPRTKGFEATVTALRPQLDAIYDVTIGFPEGIPKLQHLFFGYIHFIHLHVRRFPIASLPLKEKEIGDWVWEKFVEKDKLLEHFAKYKTFPS